MFDSASGPARPEGRRQRESRKVADKLNMTPQDVQEKQFDRVKRGLDPQQVGMFLDEVAAALAGRDRELHETQTEIEALGREVVDVKQNEEAFRLTMMAATEAKEEMLRRAAEEAAKIEADARASAELTLERAQIEADHHATALRREIELLEAEKQRVELQLADVRATAQTAHNSIEELAAGQESSGRPPLELVVDQDQDQDVEADETSGLAARVGDLRG